jgi:hypothetical protein
MKRLLGLGILAVGAIATPAVRGVEKEDIDKAVERGVKALRALQSPNGSWPQPNGMTGLAAVTLLECDVPATDSAIRKAAEAVRNEAIGTDQVYAIATSIFFLDRLRDPIDVPLIEALTVRLLSAQMDTGGFGYASAAVAEEEKARLRAYYQKARETKPEPRKGPRTVNDLAPETRVRLSQIRLLPGEAGLPADNSNTQFATLALWVGRRHGVPVDGALALVDRRFRGSQNPDGGWSYMADRNADIHGSSPAMTCAGVLGLSVAQGVYLTTGKPGAPGARGTLDPKRDANLRAALTYLARQVDLPPSVKKERPVRLSGKNYYYLWSLERILVAMDMDRLHDKDWYTWGAELLIANQDADGRWSSGEYGGSGADTCFALLFLRKANLAGDLTDLLKKDFILKSGGTLDKDPKKPPPETGPTKPPDEGTAVKPPPETKPTFTKPDSARLAEDLVKSTRAKQGQILKELRDGKGVEFTEALAGAISQLSGDDKRQAREALTDRLARMKADTLARYLGDDNSEIRRAAALASGTREFKDQVPQLIELLNDSDQGVVLAAHLALKSMTGQKIGPSPEPWRTWWRTQGKQ